jgi:hypothetical protein
MKEIKPIKKTMETLLLKMMLSWAIMIIGFVALFAGCNNPKVENRTAARTADSTIETPPDNTRTDGIKDADPVTDTAVSK